MISREPPYSFILIVQLSRLYRAVISKKTTEYFVNIPRAHKALLEQRAERRVFCERLSFGLCWCLRYTTSCSSRYRQWITNVTNTSVSHALTCCRGGGKSAISERMDTSDAFMAKSNDQNAETASPVPAVILSFPEKPREEGAFRSVTFRTRHGHNYPASVAKLSGSFK